MKFKKALIGSALGLLVLVTGFIFNSQNQTAITEGNESTTSANSVAIESDTSSITPTAQKSTNVTPTTVVTVTPTTVPAIGGSSSNNNSNPTPTNTPTPTVTNTTTNPTATPTKSQPAATPTTAVPTQTPTPTPTATPAIPTITLETPSVLKKGQWSTITFSVTGKADSLTLNSEMPLEPELPPGCTSLGNNVPIRGLSCTPGPTYTTRIFIPENTTSTSNMFFVRVWYGAQNTSMQKTVPII